MTQPLVTTTTTTTTTTSTSSTPATIPLFTAALGKTQPQIRDDILRTLANHLRGLGVANPNVGPTSDYYGIATGVANEICAGIANGIVQSDNQMPDTAGGSYLDRWLAIFGLSRAGATQSSGVVAPTYSITQGYVLVPTGAVLIDAVGLRYQVTAGGSYGPGNPSAGQPANLYVPVQSIDTGSAVDHANGDQLTWVSYVPYVASTVSVGTTGGTDGLSGGNNSEVGQDEPPRARLMARLQNPTGGGNWSDVVGWIFDSSPDVQAGFCYPALLGPATVFGVGVAAAQTAQPLTSTSKNRSLSAALVSGVVAPYVQGKYSTRAAVIVASAVDEPTDVALLISLPAAPTAQPSGPGGGWLDGTPWPSSVGGTAPCQVTGFVQGPVTASGTTPQAVTLTGTPVANPTSIVITISSTGARGAATFSWSLNGVTQATGVLTAATYALGSTGLTANFPTGTYTSGDLYTSSSVANSFVVNATSAPQAGVSRVAYVSLSNWSLYTATVLAVSGSSGAYTVTTDTPWPNLSEDCAVMFAATPGLGAAVFPQSANQANYLAAMLSGFAALGPGEWTTSAQALVRAFRHPVPSLAWPYSLDANFLRTVEDAGTEVLSVSYLYRSATTPTVPGTPATPVTITSVDPLTLTSAAPNILVPRSLAWYAS